MSWTAVIVHWLHVLAAVLWVGGTLCLSLVVQPALRRVLGENERRAVYRVVGERLNVLQWGTWSVLLATGVWKLWLLGSFGRVLAVKLALVAAMVVLSLLHALAWGPALVSGTLAEPERAVLAGRAAFWGKVNAALLLAIVFCGVLLLVRPG
jgi:uncharacterized membrane protein